jgi:microcystin-dependent protein
MGTPFLGEIKLVSFNFAPNGWAECNGQLLPIDQNDDLFQLLGTTYGGDGQNTFALPDLRDRVPIHIGGGHELGDAGGASAHTVTLSEMPAHTHTYAGVSDAADSPTPQSNRLATVDAVTFGDAYAPPRSPVPMAPQMVSNTGGSQAHGNLQPLLVINFIIALFGAFPRRP